MPLKNTKNNCTYPNKDDIKPFYHLFWDIKAETLDPQKDATLIITQIFNYGDNDAVRKIIKLYDETFIINALENPIKGAWSPFIYKSFLVLFPEATYNKTAINKLISQNRLPKPWQPFHKIAF